MVKLYTSKSGIALQVKLPWISVEIGRWRLPDDPKPFWMGVVVSEYAEWHISCEGLLRHVFQ